MPYIVDRCEEHQDKSHTSRDRFIRRHGDHQASCRRYDPLSTPSVSIRRAWTSRKRVHRTPNFTPLTPRPDDILTYADARQAHDDGSSYGNVKGIVGAMTYAREMATRYGIVLVDAPSSQRPTLERLAAEQAGMTLPAPERIKRRTDRRFRPYAAAP